MRIKGLTRREDGKLRVQVESTAKVEEWAKAHKTTTRKEGAAVEATDGFITVWAYCGMTMETSIAAQNRTLKNFAKAMTVWKQTESKWGVRGNAYGAVVQSFSESSDDAQALAHKFSLKACKRTDCNDGFIVLDYYTSNDVNIAWCKMK